VTASLNDVARMHKVESTSTGNIPMEVKPVKRKKAPTCEVGLKASTSLNGSDPAKAKVKKAPRSQVSSHDPALGMRQRPPKWKLKLDRLPSRRQRKPMRKLVGV
jgi:hypothetical protein